MVRTEAHRQDEQEESRGDGGDGEREPAPGDIEVGFELPGQSVGRGGVDGCRAETGVHTCQLASLIGAEEENLEFRAERGGTDTTNALVMLMARLSSKVWRPARPALLW